MLLSLPIYLKPTLTNCKQIEGTTLNYLVGHALEEHGCGRDLLGSREEAVGEMAAVGQVQPHDPVVGLHYRGVYGKVSGGPWGERKTFLLTLINVSTYM